MTDAATPTIRRAGLAVYSALLMGFGGCTSTPSPPNDGSPEGPMPNYRAIIAKSLKAKKEFYNPERNSSSEFSYFIDREGIFQPDKKIDHVEISDTIRKVQTNIYSWAWEACVRLNVNNSLATYAVFIIDERVVDARAANPTDNCEGGNYAPLDIRDERNNQVNRPARKTGK